MTSFPDTPDLRPPDSPLEGWGTPHDYIALTPLNNASPRLEASRVIKTGPGRLFGITVTSTRVSAQFFQVFDASSLPADGAVPLISKSIPAGDAVGFSWLPARTFLVGIVVCNSSTQGTKTIGVADCIFDAQFI